ncbi:MAG TPA: Gfo/Idh/MocA family oxidoreductase, partial [Anaerolineales bacterium]
LGVASASGVSAAQAARRYGFRYATSQESDVLSDTSINTVAILTRHHLHASQVISALDAGKNVFCEKPLALTREELEDIAATLVRINEKQDEVVPLLMVGFNRRFSPMAKKLQAFLADRHEPLVAHYRVNAGYIPSTHWVQDPAQGGGRIIGEGCHFVDFLTYLVGAPPVSVVGQAMSDNGHYQGDNVVLTFTFADGSVGTLTYLANGDKAFPKERVEVFAEGRVAVLDDFRALEMVRDGKRDSYRSRLRQDKGHAGEWQALIAAISAGGPPPIPYDHIIGVTQATFAAVEALRNNERRLVKFQE